MEPLPKQLWEFWTIPRLARLLLALVIGWVFVQVLAYFELVITIFVLAAIMAFLLSYPVQWLKRYTSHLVAVMMVILATLLGVGAIALTVGLTFLAQTQGVVDNIADLLNTLAGFLEQGEDILSRWDIELDLEGLEDQLRDQALSLLGSGFLTLQGLLLNGLNLILVIVVAFFLLLDGQRLWGLLLKPFAPDWQMRITMTIRRNFLGFFWGRFLLSLFFGLSSFVVFWLLGVPYALALATIAGIADLVPGIGATIGISLVALILLPQSLWLSLQVLVSAIALQQVEENLLLPHIMKGALDINPVVMFFALLVGATVAGLLGVFLAVPVAGVIISLFDIQEMRGHNPPLPLPVVSPELE